MRKGNYLLTGGLAAAALGMWWRGKRQTMDLECCDEEITEYGTIIYHITPLP